MPLFEKKKRLLETLTKGDEDLGRDETVLQKPESNSEIP